MELEVIIGLEIHAQLSSQSKLFCACDNDAFGAKSNTRVCPICMGHPGTLPVLNQVALDKAIAGATALNCEIQDFCKFDRKNYFYPDLPFGYQISQFDQPLALKGNVTFYRESDDQEISVKINRVHVENDAGKLVHEGNNTFLDYNRSGTPLIEIVTEPDIHSSEDAQLFAKEVQKILRHAQASDVDMEKGMMRFDASISLRPIGEDKLFPRTEVKNLNSFSALAKAINFEVKRQKKLWKAGTPPNKETTVGWLDDKEATKLLRDKESANDYRYFPEPDIPPLTFSQENLEQFKADKIELPLQKFKRYRDEFKLTTQEALKLSEDALVADFFEEAGKGIDDKRKIANWILAEIIIKDDWRNSEITPQHLQDILALLQDNRISSTSAKEIIAQAFSTGKSVEEIAKENNLEQVSDDSAIEEWVDEVLKNNPKIVEDFKAGKEKVVGFLVGQVMQKSQGSANPPLVKAMMLKKLQS
jgi:aspartyl-tRNA(Asn)/glutamyl-tRNA(Gln) amidotransferase subunit B